MLNGLSKVVNPIVVAAILALGSFPARGQEEAPDKDAPPTGGRHHPEPEIKDWGFGQRYLVIGDMWFELKNPPQANDAKPGREPAFKPSVSPEQQAFLAQEFIVGKRVTLPESNTECICVLVEDKKPDGRFQTRAQRASTRRLGMIVNPELEVIVRLGDKVEINGKPCTAKLVPVKRIDFDEHGTPKRAK